MSTESTIAALGRLAIKNGVTLGNMSRPDLLLTLALASLCLPASAQASEPVVNAALQAWLVGTGAMLKVDHVELRRTLIDFGLWERDGFGRVYRRAAAVTDPELEASLASLRTLDAADIIAERRTHHIAERARRKELSGAHAPAQEQPQT
jgi:hypothetical protein